MPSAFFLLIIFTVNISIAGGTKRKYPECAQIEYNLEENLVRLQEELKEQPMCHPVLSVCYQPKLRRFCGGFHDRVVHHILVSALEKIWERALLRFLCMS